jgi:integrase/recombinase XerD
MEHEPLLISYLKQKGKSKTTIVTYLKIYRLYERWATCQRLDPEYANHTDLLDYIAHLRQQGLVQNTIQNYLGALVHYFEALVDKETIVHNPANYIQLKSQPKHTLHTILSKGQLEELYTNFEVKGKRKTKASAHASALRNRIAVGLMVFQGLDVKDLGRLLKEDVNVLNGTVHIRASRTSAARTLALQAIQIIELDRYIGRTRKELQQHFNKEDSELLLITGYSHYYDAHRRLMQRLQKQEKTVKSTAQLRASVITHWLKQYNLREVQYMAGHKQIHSTEAYQRNDTEGLQMDIDRLHPSVNKAQA